MNTKEFKNLNNTLIKGVQVKLDKIGDGNAIVELQNNQHFNNTVVYGISSVDGNPPYEAYELYNDGNSASWSYKGRVQ